MGAHDFGDFVEFTRGDKHDGRRPNELFRRTDAPEGPFFMVVLSEAQLQALESAAATAARIWDGTDDDAIAEQGELAGAQAAIANAEEIV